MMHLNLQKKRKKNSNLRSHINITKTYTQSNTTHMSNNEEIIKTPKRSTNKTKNASPFPKFHYLYFETSLRNFI